VVQVHYDEGVAIYIGPLRLEERGDQVKEEEYQRDHRGRRYPAGPTAMLHRPDPIMIVAEPSFVVELAYIKLPF
jgi:hypothetical protein